MCPLTKVHGNVDQRIKRESRNAPTQKLIKARLRDAAMFCRFRLRLAFGLNQRRDFVHQLKAQPQVGSFFWRVCDGAPHAGAAVDFVITHCLSWHLNKRKSPGMRLQQYWIRPISNWHQNTFIVEA